MARVIKQTWSSDPSSGLSRRDRRSCEYEAYLPDTISGRRFRFGGDVVADIAEAEAAVISLQGRARALVDTEALARLLLRAESVASSHMEGLQVGGRRLLRAEAARAAGLASGDVTADEVLGNIDAMRLASGLAVPGSPPTTVDDLLAIHARLLAGTRLTHQAGLLRQEQNWIGGSSYNPCSASFVPCPPKHVAALVEDLCAFLAEDDLPAVAQAAIAHAQLETIHPFVDGNGRTGRALIHLVLRRRGLTPLAPPPISLVLATWAGDYVDALMATRYRGPASSSAAADGIDRWVALFAAACRRSVDDALAFEEAIDAVERSWRERLGRMRTGSASDLLLRHLPGAPIVTVAAAAELTGRSVQAANEAVARLEDAGILTQITVGRRNRAFEAPEVIEVFTDLERRLASPAGDTRVSPPSRPTPARRR